MTAAEARQRLDELDARAEEASARYRTAREAVRAGASTPRDVLEELKAYWAAVHFHQREESPDENRRVTLGVVHRVQRDGLVLVPIDPTRPAAGLRLHDPRPRQELEDAALAARHAHRERTRFAQHHAELLRREDEARQMEALRAAFAGSDPEAARDALAGLPDTKPSNPSAMTTDDLPR